MGVKNADNLVEIKVKCLLTGSNFIHDIWDQQKGNIKTPMMDAGEIIAKNSTLYLAAAVP